MEENKHGGQKLICPTVISLLNVLVPAMRTTLGDVSVNWLPDNTEVLWMSVVTSAFSSISLV